MGDPFEFIFVSNVLKARKAKKTDCPKCGSDKYKARSRFIQWLSRSLTAKKSCSDCGYSVSCPTLD